ncbi:MAG: helix-turn-helix transcriptional regulator [Clostridia bacterium]|nr:helix-turn-helix transcriptional regulator [Clostridia bacterium]
MNQNHYGAYYPLSDLEKYNGNKGNAFIEDLERRYSIENEMIKAVSQGNYKALKKIITADIFVENVEPRTKDSVRNLKNYMIIFNTLLRKGAEIGNVHPFYIHSLSADFAGKIETCETSRDIAELWNEMGNAYCTLVKNHRSKGYSPLVQNIVMLIEADLNEDLTLGSLAKKMNVNASYLSSLFKKDTGRTLTEYVNSKKIDRAKYLLETTTLQVQNISQECGFSDVNYFVKIFKKNTNKTPKQYREDVKN